MREALGKERVPLLDMASPRSRKLFLINSFREALSSFSATALEHALARGGGTAFAKAMLALRLDITGLERTFHRGFLVKIFEEYFSSIPGLENIFAFFSQRQKKFTSRPMVYLF